MNTDMKEGYSPRFKNFIGEQNNTFMSLSIM